MGRIRSIKPEFFKHGDLYDAEQSSGLPLRVAFAGLWTVCDREGRFKWKPRDLKIDILPFDDLDFSSVLNALVEHGFVVRYEVSGKSYGYVPTFLDHQCPNVKERASTIPAPYKDDANPDAGTDPDSDEHCGEGKGTEGKGTGKEASRDDTVHGDDFTPIEAAQYVQHELNISGVRQLRDLGDVIQQAIVKSKLDARLIAERMVKTWERYGHIDSEYKVGVMKFFCEGIWLDESRWPKAREPNANGSAPPPPKSRRKTLAELNLCQLLEDPLLDPEKAPKLEDELRKELRRAGVTEIENMIIALRTQRERLKAQRPN